MKSNTLSWDDPQYLEKLGRVLRENKVILAPSDTVWGLCAAPTLEAFKELNRLKVRNDKPYLLLARDLEAVRTYAHVPHDPVLQKLLSSFWPGPLTVIFKALPGVPQYLLSADHTIAFRIPRHEPTERILSQVPVLFSTSANISGEPVPVTYLQVSPLIRDHVALAIVPEEPELAQSSVPSTIIDISKGTMNVVREGAILSARLNEYWGK